MQRARRQRPILGHDVGAIPRRLSRVKSVAFASALLLSKLPADVEGSLLKGIEVSADAIPPVNTSTDVSVKGSIAELPSAQLEAELPSAQPEAELPSAQPEAELPSAQPEAPLPAEVTAEVPKKRKARRRRPKQEGQPLAAFCQYFRNGPSVKAAISTEGGERQFYEKYKEIFELPAISTFILELKEPRRREVKKCLADVCSHLEEVWAHAIEASDFDLEQRRERHENASVGGKTAIFVAIFRVFLDWIYGKEFLEKAQEAGIARNRLMMQLKERGLDKIPPGLTEEILEASKKIVKPHLGAPLDVEHLTEWPQCSVKSTA